MSSSVVIFGRHPDQGFGCLYSSSNVSASLRDNIMRSNDGINDMGTSRSDEISYRYMTIHGQKVLSVFLMFGGTDRINPKRSYGVVNFILDRNEVTSLFKEGQFSDILQKTGQVAWNEYYVHGLRIEAAAIPPMPACLKEPLVKAGRGRKNYDFTLAPLLTAATYSYYKKPEQGYFVTDEALGILENFISFLPPVLRESVSFHTDVIGCNVANGVDICFLSPANMSLIEKGNFYGRDREVDIHSYTITDSQVEIRKNADQTGIQTTKAMLDAMDDMPYRKIFKPAITESVRTWSDWMSFASILRQPNALQAMMEKLDEGVLIKCVKNTQLSEMDIAPLEKAAKKANCTSLRSTLLNMSHSQPRQSDKTRSNGTPAPVAKHWNGTCSLPCGVKKEPMEGNLPSGKGVSPSEIVSERNQGFTQRTWDTAFGDKKDYSYENYYQDEYVNRAENAEPVPQEDNTDHSGNANRADRRDRSRDSFARSLLAAVGVLFANIKSWVWVLLLLTAVGFLTFNPDNLHLTCLPEVWKISIVIHPLGSVIRKGLVMVLMCTISFIIGRKWEKRNKK